MKPIEMLICSGCGEYAGSHIDAVIGGLQTALSKAIARAERADAALLEIAEQTKGVTPELNNLQMCIGAIHSYGVMTMEAT